MLCKKLFFILINVLVKLSIVGFLRCFYTVFNLLPYIIIRPFVLVVKITEIIH